MLEEQRQHLNSGVTELKSQEVSGRRRSEGESPEFRVRAVCEVREEAGWPE